jgi:SAM-dependent methyltransferase
MTTYTERFTGRAADYAQYRERYEAGVVLPLLRNWCGLTPEWLVADVGAGTGMVGDLFRVNGNPVVAIEPNVEMRAACAALHADDALFKVVDGAAETIGLPDASVEMIAVGRALHWFDAGAAFREFRRILKPQGWVTILAGGRSEDGREENVAYRQFLHTATGRDFHRDPLLAVYRQLDSLFIGGRLFHAEVPGEMHLGWDELRGLTLSLSNTPMSDSAAFPVFEAGLRSYFDGYQQNGRVTMATSTWVNAGQLARQ